MNKEFEQWVKGLNPPTGHYNMAALAYHYLQANPHLLREDGNNIPRYENPPTPPPRPTDMEQEAREMMQKTIYTDGEGIERSLWDMIWFGIKNLCTEECTCHAECKIADKMAAQLSITALTEFGKMWKERGREEIFASVYFRSLKAAIDELEKELTAAKEQIAKLEQQNADLELALKNL